MRTRFLALPLLAILAGCAPQIVVAPFAFSVPLAPGCDGQFDVVNQSSRTVRRFIARQGPGAPESDRLGHRVLPPGSFVAVTAAPGLNDLRAEFADGGPRELRRIDVCALDAVIVTEDGLRPR
jgi:hypothetical protein